MTVPAPPCPVTIPVGDCSRRNMFPSGHLLPCGQYIHSTCVFILMPLMTRLYCKRGLLFTCFDWRLRLYPNPRYMGEVSFLFLFFTSRVYYISTDTDICMVLYLGIIIFFLFLANRDISIVSTYMVSHGIAFYPNYLYNLQLLLQGA